MLILGDDSSHWLIKIYQYLNGRSVATVMPSERSSACLLRSIIRWAKYAKEIVNI
jgi:hypothetical protein